MIKVGDKVKVKDWGKEYYSNSKYMNEYATEAQKKRWRRTQRKDYDIRYNEVKEQVFTVKRIDQHIFGDQKIVIISNKKYCFMMEINGLQKVEANDQNTK